MNCKYCGEQLPEKGTFCPVCGKDNGVEPEKTVVTDGQQPVEAGQKKKKSVAMICACAAAMLVLAVALFLGVRGGTEGAGKLDVAGWFDWEVFRDNDIHKQDSYTVSDKKAERRSDAVVATLGEAELTNGLLQVYYQNEVVNFINQNSYYLSYMGLDYTKPLGEQMCMFQEGYTWQQYFLEVALNTWKEIQALALEASKNGYQLEQEVQLELDKLAENLEKNAKQYGYESADAYVKEQFGAACTVADICTYTNLYYLASGYLYDTQTVPTDDEVRAYFETNKQTLEEAGIKQDGACFVDVRHILVLIDNIVKDVPDPDGVKGEDGYTPAQWDACKAAAQVILDQWLENPTEENFAALANEKSHDRGGNVTDGGIYTDITPATSFVKPFLEWCVDPARQVGDYGLVQTEYGYHVMFFSKRGEEVWLNQTRQTMQIEQSSTMLQQVVDSYEVTISYGKIALAEVDLA